ncbi:MAG: hypothetical protein E5V86_06595 [Mesorhizobium sp.]|nr:MAG: hypothetical protein E5W02_12930 [Mesorhizobium sp.]TIV66974.1 MAG: hypothetical protein E5V86_06595 [Mesorhizobium sp.]
MWTTIGVIVSGLTLLAAGAAAKFARDAALHTETGANAAKDALDHAKATSKLELRAYIDVADARLEGDLFSPVMVIAVKNFGQTLAKVVQVRTVVDLGREPLPEPTLPDEWRTDSGIQLAPGNDWIFRFPYDVQQAVEADGKGGVIARVTGQVRYFDVTGEKRETHFRIRTAGHRLGENMRIFPDKIGNYIT